MSKINIDRKTISKLCVKCHRNNLIDDVEFVVDQFTCRYAKGDICIECYPHLHKEYKDYMKNTRKSRKALNIDADRNSTIHTNSYSRSKSINNY